MLRVSIRFRNMHEIRRICIHDLDMNNKMKNTNASNAKRHGWTNLFSVLSIDVIQFCFPFFNYQEKSRNMKSNELSISCFCMNETNFISLSLSISCRRRCYFRVRINKNMRITQTRCRTDHRIQWTSDSFTRAANNNNKKNRENKTCYFCIWNDWVNAIRT